MDWNPDSRQTAAPDLLCFSHLRWDFVFQRPHHLLTRAARERRVFYVEEPLVGDGPARVELTDRAGGVRLVTMHVPADASPESRDASLRELLDAFLTQHGVRDFVAWYYTPMALAFTRHLRPAITVYDVMDELSLFRFAPRHLLEREAELFERADVVFTGGPSLYESKRARHPHVHLFPSSIDSVHFARARKGIVEPMDQSHIPRPRLGYFGVIDERMDIDLVAAIADAHPTWQLVMIGPVAKIDPTCLPQRSNIHWLGARDYRQLPDYIGGWDVALMPWALNDATRFISPTKTPEYLAAGRPVVSTPVTDVVRPWAEHGLVRIASDADAFAAEIAAALDTAPDERAQWLREVDAVLASTSWDMTWAAMRDLVQRATPAVRPEPRHLAAAGEGR